MNLIPQFLQSPKQARITINHRYPNDQIKRIQLKLPLASKVDNACELFGASSHHYQLNPPIALCEIEKWQKRNNAKLPDDFVVFLTQIGNGGAGPYYGIERFEDSENRYDQVPGLPSLLSPNMSEQAWQAMSYIDDDCSDEEFDQRENLIHQGLFYLGTCGCEYDLLLVITGEFSGRVIYTHHWCDSDKPYFFAYEMSFLDWYERWLDEVIQEFNTSWFGHKMGGDEPTLLAAYLNAQTDNDRIEAICGLNKLPSLSTTGLETIEQIIKDGNEIIYPYALKILAQFAADRTINYLLVDLNSDNVEKISQATEIVYFNHKANLLPFYQALMVVLANSTDNGTVRFIGYVLDEMNKVEVEDFAHLFNHENGHLATTAIYAASKDQALSQKIGMFFGSVASDNDDVALISIQAVAQTKQFYEEALPFLKQAWQRFPPEKNEYIRNNIRSYLRNVNSPIRFE